MSKKSIKKAVESALTDDEKIVTIQQLQRKYLEHIFLEYDSGTIVQLSKKVEEIRTEFSKWIAKNIEFSRLTPAIAEALGMKEIYYDLWIFPNYLYTIIPDGIVVTTKSYEKMLFRKNDTTRGYDYYLKFGIQIKTEEEEE
jgi:hypothetical protein